MPIQYPDSVERAVRGEPVGTPPLHDFVQAYTQDGNVWWRLDCGHHQNLLDEALDLLADLGWGA